MSLKSGTFLVVMEGDSIQKSMAEHSKDPMNGQTIGFDTLEEALSFGIEQDDDFDLYVSFRGQLVNMNPQVKAAASDLLAEYLELNPQAEELIDYSDVV